MIYGRTVSKLHHIEWRTTELTVKGFAIYLEQVYADGASMGVRFHANPNEVRMVA